MRAKAIRGTGLAGLFIVVLGAGCPAAKQAKPVLPQLTEAEQARGQAIFQEQSCGICHGENGEGGEAGPALHELAPFWNEERLASYLLDPLAFAEANPEFDARREVEYEVEMPAYDYLAGEDLRVFTAWLMTR